jgi:putative glutamine amidotransferase
VAHSLEDGLLEAVEHQHHPWAIGVQWHPELSPNAPEHRRIFHAFVKATEARKGLETVDNSQVETYVQPKLVNKKSVA